MNQTENNIHKMFKVLILKVLLKILEYTLPREIFLIYRKSLELEDRERKLKEREDQVTGKGVSIFFLSL